MDNFDDLMRHKYDNDDPAGRFEFREEYWEQARALIEADEARRRKRRRGLLWWTFAGLLLIGAGGLGWWRAAAGHVTSDASHTNSIGQPNSASTVRMQKISPSSVSEQHSEAEMIRDSSIEINDTKTGRINSKYKTIENASIYSNKNALNPAVKEQPLSFSDGASRNKKVTASQTGTGTLSTRTQRKGTSGGISKGTQVESQVPGQSPGETGTPFSPVAADAPGDISAKSMALNTTAEMDNASAPTDDVSKQLKKLLAQLFTLPLPFQPVSSDSTRMIKTPDKATTPILRELKPLKYQRFTTGVMAAASAYHPAPDRRWVGFSASAFGAYRLGNNWYASVGLGLRYQPGSWIDSTGVEVTESLRYSFGFTSIRSERRALGLLSLEIPVAARWYHRAFAFEAGVAPGRLLYALDRYKEVKETSLEGQKTTRNRFERSDTAPYVKTYFNTFLGAEWRFNRNTSLTLRGNYRLGAILKGNSEHPAIKGGSNVELGIRLKLF